MAKKEVKIAAGERKKYRIRGEFAICFIAVLNSFSVYLLLYSRGGMPSISSVPYIFSEAFPVGSLGLWTYLFQSSLIAVLIIMRLRRGEKRYIPIYLCSFLAGGAFSFMMDVHAIWINRLPQTLPLCLLYFVISFLGLAFGIALSNHCKMPIIPTDLFPRELTVLLDKSYKRVKTIFDLSCLTTTIVISLGILHAIRGIGIGTVLCAFTMGKVISAMGERISKYATFVSFIEPEEKFAEGASTQEKLQGKTNTN